MFRIGVAFSVFCVMTGCAIAREQTGISEFAIEDCLAFHQKWNAQSQAVGSNGLECRGNAFDRAYVFRTRRKLDVVFMQGEAGYFGPETPNFHHVCSCMYALETTKNPQLRLIFSRPWYDESSSETPGEYRDPVVHEAGSVDVKAELFLPSGGRLQFSRERVLDNTWFIEQKEKRLSGDTLR